MYICSTVLVTRTGLCIPCIVMQPGTRLSFGINKVLPYLILYIHVYIPCIHIHVYNMYIACISHVLVDLLTIKYMPVAASSASGLAGELGYS